MMHRPSSLFAALLIALLAAACVTAPDTRDEDLCPATAQPPETAPAPEGWRAWRSDEARTQPLTSISFSDGDPQERVFLAPDASTTQDQRSVDLYDFTSPTLRKIWVICQYKGTSVALVRPTKLLGKKCGVDRAMQAGRGDGSSFISCR